MSAAAIVWLTCLGSLTLYTVIIINKDTKQFLRGEDD